MESLRREDSRTEQVIAAFLDEYLYKIVCKDFQRFSSREDQLAGKDIQLEIDNIGVITVDEKAQGHYINRNLPTFAFEIGAFVNKIHRIGWFINRTLATEYYLLVWIKAKKEKNISKEDITELDCILLEKRALEAHLLTQGLKLEDLAGFEQHFRIEKQSGALMKEQYGEFYFFLSNQLEEKPFNLIVRKGLLEKLCVAQWIVTPENIITKKAIVVSVK